MKLLINWTLYTRGTRIHLYHSPREGVIINGLIDLCSLLRDTVQLYTLYWKLHIVEQQWQQLKKSHAVSEMWIFS